MLYGAHVLVKAGIAGHYTSTIVYCVLNESWNQSQHIVWRTVNNKTQQQKHKTQYHNTPHKHDKKHIRLPIKKRLRLQNATTTKAPNTTPPTHHTNTTKNAFVYLLKNGFVYTIQQQYQM